MPHTTELWIVAYEVRKLSTLLNEIGLREARDAFLKPTYPQEIAQYLARIMEAQRLVEIGSD